ncbi:MAG TPA: pre-peptidase C-terminal domain-containing protein, partial [Kofleriaceae bacterium]|nr:pre-peptidase C-terminal domain-containing protein [Kofleriaceae bacterium]
MSRPVLLALAVALLAATAGCGGGAAPELDSIPDQRVAVGQELTFELVGTDADGDDLDYTFSSDVPDLGTRATITKSPAGTGVFRWRPLAADVGTWHFDLTASDGDHDTTQTIMVEVRSAIGDATVPVFRQPLGTGTTLDLAVRSCLDLDILVEDQDSTQVAIAQDEPVIEGAELTQTTAFAATWHWCPTRDQIDSDTQYTLTLSADDGDNPPTVKNYLVVLRPPPQQNCPHEPPVVTHTPANVSQVVDLTIDATITDDLGLRAAPLLYWSTNAPANPPDLGQLQQVTMLQIDGDLRSGTWAADVPNPVATMPMGSTATVYYVIVAADDDDPAGSCDHQTQAPVQGVYQLRVTNPGGQGNLGVCTGCSADIQCGDADDDCVRVGAGDYCLKSCDTSADCPANYTCPTAPVTSVNGVTSRQCQPVSGSCTNMPVCMDDTFENNDTRAQANAQPAITPMTYHLVSCPLADGSNDDEDWLKFVIAADASVTFTLNGTSVSDLDLAIYDSAGTRLASATGPTSMETITHCLTPGTYFVRVYAFGAGAMNAYTLTYAKTAMACTVACTDDGHEQDDDLAHARSITYPTYTSTMNQICANDDDWYKVLMFDGERAVIDLTFAQTAADQDLDLHWYDSTGVDLTPCSEAMPATCTSAQGQGAVSNEHFEFTAPPVCSTLCTYYVAVHGWAGS